MTRPLRIVLIAVAGVILALAGAAAAVFALIDPNTYKPDIIEAVKRGTGRDLTLNGKISLEPSLWPTLRVDDAAFSNPPGFSRPQMVTVQGMEVQLSLWPLLSSRFEIDRMVLTHPDILLETDADGHPNWQMAPEVSPGPAAAVPQAPVPASHRASVVIIDAVRILDGTLGYRDDATGKLTTIVLSKLEASAASPGSPLHLAADAVYNGTAFNLIADTGSLTRLQDPAASSPWPVKLALTAAGAKLAADGSMTRPLQGKGYELDVSGTVPDASAIAPLLQRFVATTAFAPSQVVPSQGVPSQQLAPPQVAPSPQLALFRGFVVPPLHDVSFAARIADTGDRLPDISALTLHVGASDLSAEIPGLTLEKLDIDAPKASQPVKLDAAGRFDDAPLTLAGTFGAPALLMPDAKPAPFPVELTVRAAGATASAKGAIANASAMTGVNIALAANIPDLSALSPLVRRPLPALKTVAFQGTLTDADGGFRHGMALHGFSLAGPDGDLSGDAAIDLTTQPSLTATLKSNRIDADALQAAFAQTPADAALPPPAGANSAPPAGSRSAPSTASQAPQSPRRRGDRLFADRPIPYDLLRLGDADLKLDIADLRSGGADYKAIDGHAVLAHGKLTVDPFAADLPGGRLTGTLSADAMQTAPPLHVVLHAPGMAARTFFAAANLPAYATGNVEVYADLTGTGDTPHAIAASLDGSLGLAMAGGTIDNRLLGSLLGKLLEALNALDLVAKGGTSQLQCFAVRMDARHGVGAIRPLALRSSLLTMTGLGTINLGNETLALALRPQARVAGTGLVIPIAVSGPIRDPSVKVNDLGAAEANVGTIAGAVLGDATPLGIIGGLLGADRLFGGGPADICAPALALARGEAVREPAPSRAAQPSVSNPEAFLRNLFR